MDYSQGLILVVVGTAAGFLNVVAAGGSMLSVPVMVFMGIPGPVVNGTNRIAILAQNITAVITFFRQGYSNFGLSLSLSLCALPGAALGAMVGTRLEGVWFNRVLAVVMVGVMILMSLPRREPTPQEDTPVSRKRLVAGHLLMVLAGVYGGFIQIGVGFILLPILHRVLGLNLVHANMHKVFIIGSYTVLALLIFMWQVKLLWFLGLCLAVGNSVGAWLGAHLSINKGENSIRLVINTVLVVFIIKLLFFS